MGTRSAPLPQPTPCDLGDGELFECIVTPATILQHLDEVTVEMLVTQQLVNLYGICGTAAIRYTVQSFDATSGKVVFRAMEAHAEFLQRGVLMVSSYRGQPCRLEPAWT
jgi:RNase P/RNase MRP subunit POP5